MKTFQVGVLQYWTEDTSKERILTFSGIPGQIFMDGQPITVKSERDYTDNDSYYVEELLKRGYSLDRARFMAVITSGLIDVEKKIHGQLIPMAREHEALINTLLWKLWSGDPTLPRASSFRIRGTRNELYLVQLIPFHKEIPLVPVTNPYLEMKGVEENLTRLFISP